MGSLDNQHCLQHLTPNPRQSWKNGAFGGEGGGLVTTARAVEAERHLLANMRIAAGLWFGCPGGEGAAGEQVTWSAASS